MTEKRENEIFKLCNSLNAVAGGLRLKGDKRMADLLIRAQGAIMELIRELEKPQPKTIADQIRAMSDEQLAEKFYDLYRKLMSAEMNDLSDLFCDGNANCITKTGNIRCTPKKEKACVLRWLQRPAEEGDHD